MKAKRGFSVSFLLYLFYVSLIDGQDVIPSSGGTESGPGGSVTWTTGQTSYSVHTGINGFIIQGVQQPFEISVVTDVENTGYITLDYTVYPNPSEGAIKLVISSFTDEDYKFQLYNLNGVVLMNEKITGNETEISLDKYFSGTYFLRVIRDNIEAKVFKIVIR